MAGIHQIEQSVAVLGLGELPGAQWWAVWHPGAELGDGSCVTQCMLASKSEKDSL
jgi:hypothetical protein